MVVTFSEKSTIATKKYVLKQGIKISKSFKKLWINLVAFLPPFSLYTNSLKKGNFWSLRWRMVATIS